MTKIGEGNLFSMLTSIIKFQVLNYREFKFQNLTDLIFFGWNFGILFSDHWDFLIIFMLSSKLDNRSVVKWEKYRKSLDDVPSLDQFKNFLIDRADVL